MLLAALAQDQFVKTVVSSVLLNTTYSGVKYKSIMDQPEYADQEKTIVEKYLFTPGKLSSLGNLFTKSSTVARRDERIFNAIEAGDAKTLQFVLDRGGDPDTVFIVDTLLKSRWSALQQCCQKGHYDCAKVLIEKGACMEIADGLGQTALYYCICCEWLEIMELLIESGCNKEASDSKKMAPLHRAVSCTTTGPLEILLKSGVYVDPRDLRQRTPLWIAASQDGKLEFIKLLLKHGALYNCFDGPEQITPLQSAVMHAGEDKLKYIDLLLENGASVNAQNHTAPSAIQSVILRGRSNGAVVTEEEIKLTHLFLQKGCKVNHITDNTGWHFMRGTALKMAADRGCLALVKILLEAGANPDLTDTDTYISPLLIATKKRHFDIVLELLRYNARMDIQGLLKLQASLGVQRLNPFLCSLQQGFPEIARLLIDCGYNLRAEKYLWTSEDVPEYLTIDIDMWLWLQERISQPLTLMETVKISLRKKMGYRIAQNLELISLPPVLKRYLLCVEPGLEQ